MLNIYLVQLFSNWVRGNNKGCLRAPGAGTHNIRICREKTKRKTTEKGIEDFIYSTTAFITVFKHDLNIKIMSLLDQTFYCPKTSITKDELDNVVWGLSSCTSR